MILYIENLKDSTKKLSELINKVVGYKINIQKSVVFLYSNKELSERENKKTAPLNNCIKKNKIALVTEPPQGTQLPAP